MKPYFSLEYTDTMWVNVYVRQLTDSAYDAGDAALAVVVNLPRRSPVNV